MPESQTLLNIIVKSIRICMNFTCVDKTTRIVLVYSFSVLIHIYREILITKFPHILNGLLCTPLFHHFLIHYIPICFLLLRSKMEPKLNVEGKLALLEQALRCLTKRDHFEFHSRCFPKILVSISPIHLFAISLVLE